MSENFSAALIDGSPMKEFPKDLHIPPDALRVFIELFEGPLDLLLYLVRRQNIDILEVEVAEITKQYIDYINLMEALEIDLAEWTQAQLLKPKFQRVPIAAVLYSSP